MLREDREPYRSGCPAFVAGKIQGLHEVGQELARYATNLIGIFNISDQDDKFIPAKSGDNVASPDARTQSVCDLDKQGVAGGMAKRVVDHLEAVEIDEQHCTFLSVASRRFHRLFKQFTEQHAVRQSCQPVVRCKVL